MSENVAGALASCSSQINPLLYISSVDDLIDTKPSGYSATLGWPSKYLKVIEND
jgi:hypothetical protein